MWRRASSKSEPLGAPNRPGSARSQSRLSFLRSVLDIALGQRVVCGRIRDIHRSVLRGRRSTRLAIQNGVDLVARGRELRRGVGGLVGGLGGDLPSRSRNLLAFACAASARPRKRSVDVPARQRRLAPCAFGPDSVSVDVISSLDRDRGCSPMSPRVHIFGISTRGGALPRGPLVAGRSRADAAVPALSGLLSLLLTSP